MKKKFPRKEIYICIFKKPINSKKISTNNLGELKLDEDFKEYAEDKWNKENKDWISSRMSSAIELFVGKDSLKINYKITEYKYFLGNVKKAIEKRTNIGIPDIEGMANEIIPITLDNFFPLERRDDSETTHAGGYYDIPSAGQNAEVWLENSKKFKQELIKNIGDMEGFPKWNLIRHLELRENEIGEIFYNGFSKGFEVASAIVFGGLTKVNVYLKDLIKRGKNKERCWYSLDDIPEILNSIGNDGKNQKIKEDFFGKIPEPTEDGFKIVENSIGTILSNLLHLKGRKNYEEAKEILKKKGYTIKEIKSKEKIVLSEIG